MDTRPRLRNSPFGIRAKLILLFVVIKVVPLVLLALLAWEGISRLGSGLASETDSLVGEVRKAVSDMGATFSREAVRALDNRAREELERLTTDTARAVAGFLQERDQDILLAARLGTDERSYRAFIDSRQHSLTDTGRWELDAEGKGWQRIADDSPRQTPRQVSPGNAENSQDFHYRPPETVLRSLPRPLYHEITYIGLDGKEKLKVSATDLMPRDLRDVSVKANTWCKAEDYFAELKKLKPGEIYVSDVIGAYVPSRIIGPVTPARAEKAGIAFEPQKEAYAGTENPVGQRFQGIIRWATPVTKDGKIVGYVTLALDHTHVMSFTDNLMPTPARYTAIADAISGNYAFMWDYQDRSIAHPRHHSIVGFDPATGERAVPWLEAGLYDAWQKSGKPLEAFLAEVPVFDGQSRDKKPSPLLTRQGMVGLDCRYLNFAPQCQGWHDLTHLGGSGSFLIQWTGVWKLTTAAAIPYFTGQYGKTPRGFGFVTIGANVEDFHAPAQATARQMDERVAEFARDMKERQQALHREINSGLEHTAISLSISTALMALVVIAIAIWLASVLTRQITRIIAGLGRIEGGDLSFRFRDEGSDELGQLSASLNTMAGSVQESFQRLDEARVQAEENSRMKSDFVAHMSHELRTPLNGILGFAELITLDAPTDEIREHAETIRQSGQHLLSVVNDVLDIAKIESGNMVLDDSPVRLRALLEELATLHRAAAQQKGLELRTELSDALPVQIRGDATRLRQVINNLLNNAVKFTAAGHVTLEAATQDGQVLIAVTDTGRGIPAEQQAAIFERFHQGGHFITREHGGSGLGLALVRELCALMGGEVRLQSAPGQGARFELLLPLRVQAEETQP